MRSRRSSACGRCLRLVLIDARDAKRFRQIRVEVDRVFNAYVESFPFNRR